MIIYALTIEPVITLQLVLTEEELENSLFNTVMQKMYNNNNYTAHKKDNTVNVTLNEDYSTLENMGQTVDSIRQLWCGDVDPEADLTSCPKFILGEQDITEEEKEEINFTSLNHTITK